MSYYGQIALSNMVGTRLTAPSESHQEVSDAVSSITRELKKIEREWSKDLVEYPTFGARDILKSVFRAINQLNSALRKTIQSPFVARFQSEEIDKIIAKMLRTSSQFVKGVQDTKGKSLLAQALQANLPTVYLPRFRAATIQALKTIRSAYKDLDDLGAPWYLGGAVRLPWSRNPRSSSSVKSGRPRWSDEPNFLRK